MAPAQVVRAGASITGARWSLKGRPDVLKDIPDWLHDVIKHPVADGQFVGVCVAAERKTGKLHLDDG